MDSLELLAFRAARRLAQADVQVAAAHVANSISAALGRTLSVGTPLQLRQALADLLFEEADVECDDCLTPQGQGRPARAAA